MAIPLLTFDLDRLIVSRLLVQANSGGGKSHAIRWLLETTSGRLQHIVIDREGEFSTLRARFPYLLVGPEGEVAADIRGAKLLARKLLELNLSAVLDLSELSLGQQRDYVGTFISAINHLPRALWKDCLIVIDEAHLFAPEKGKGESAAREAIALLLSIGRKRGFCPVLATQRLAKLDKDVAAECLNKLIGRTSNEDTKRAGEELAFDRKGARELRALEPGEFWAYGPAIAVDPILVRTGEVQTRPPERGALRQPAPPTPAAIRSIAQALADLPKEADAEARTFADLQKRNRELEAELRRAQRAQPAPAAAPAKTIEKVVVDEKAIVRALDRQAIAISRQNRDAAKAGNRVVTQIERLSTSLIQIFPEIQTGLKTMLTALERPVPVEAGQNGHGTPASRSSPVAVAPRPPVSTTRAQRVERAPSSSLPKGEESVLTAVAQYPDGATREQITILTGYKRSTRDAYLQRLQQAGLVEQAGSVMVATDAGVEALGPSFEPLPTGEALREYWLERLPEGEGIILATLLDAYPDPVTRDALTDITEYKRSTRDAYIQRLGTRKLVELSGGGVRASKILFED